MERRTDYKRKIRVTEINHEKLLLIKGEMGLAEKLNEILENYFQSGGKEKEIKKLRAAIKRLQE